MAKLNEIKEQKTVVESVGGFANSLQQIAASRMTILRKSVLASRRFVDEATVILKELKLEQRKARDKQIQKVIKDYKPGSRNKQAIIVISSNQGLCGTYNTEIFKKVDEIIPQYPEAEYFVLGIKGQEYFKKIAKKYNIKFYPYNVPEQVSINDLRPLISMFIHYDHIYLIYSKYINTVTRDVVFVELAIPNIPEDQKIDEKEHGKFIFEPNVDELVSVVSAKLRYSLFRQQLLDSRLSLFTAQMIAMQTASDNAKDLLKTLQQEYNKQRRKMIDKKIQEVQAGRSLWAE